MANSMTVKPSSPGLVRRARRRRVMPRKIDMRASALEPRPTAFTSFEDFFALAELEALVAEEKAAAGAREGNDLEVPVEDLPRGQLREHRVVDPDVGHRLPARLVDVEQRHPLAAPGLGRRSA